MTADRWTVAGIVGIVAVVLVVAVVSVLTGIVGSLLVWWQIGLALAVYFGLNAGLMALHRRYSLGEKAWHFLRTIPVAALLMAAVTHGWNQLAPFAFISAFVVVEALLLAFAAVTWSFRANRT